MSIVVLEDVCKSYHQGQVETIALDHLFFSLKEGEFVSIMGPSGGGKTTLLNLVGLLDTPTSGSLRFMGKEIAGMGSSQRAQLRRDHIGFVFQSFNLIDELTVRENVELPLLYQRVAAAERHRRVEEALERLQMAHKQSVFPAQLSGGQQQRVALARALVGRPRLVVADEPTGNLDSARGREVMEWLSQLNEQGTTILMATHSTAAASYGQRVVGLFDGQIVAAPTSF